MKFKEYSSLKARMLMPRGWRPWDGYFQAEFNRQVVFVVNKGFTWLGRPKCEVSIIDRELKNSEMPGEDVH